MGRSTVNVYGNRFMNCVFCKSYGIQSISVEYTEKPTTGPIIAALVEMPRFPAIVCYLHAVITVGSNGGVNRGNFSRDLGSSFSVQVAPSDNPEHYPTLIPSAHSASQTSPSLRPSSAMTSLHVPALRYTLGRSAPLLRSGQRRWAQVHDVRFVATHHEPDRILERYKEKLDRKAKE